MKDRLSNVRKLLTKQNLDAALISSHANIIYLTNFLGFSKEERDAHLLITKKEAYIFTNALYSEAVYEKVPHFTMLEITSNAPFVELLKVVTLKHKIKKIGVEEKYLTVYEYKNILSLRSLLASQGYSQKIEIRNLETHSLRIKKDNKEIYAITKACEISDKAFEFILKKLKPGVTEQEIAFQLEIFMKENGADPSFPPIVAFGKNSSIPHHKCNDQRLATNDIVLLDFGARYNGYCSDMTRTVFFGKATKEQKRMYDTVLTAQQKAIKFFSKYPSPSGRGQGEGVKGSDVDKIARDYILSQGYPTIPHSLGHGIGLQVHESPSLSPKSKDVLREGMVFSIEPGIYMKGVGGIRIEDLFTIQNGKLTQLTKSPKNFIEL